MITPTPMEKVGTILSISTFNSKYTTSKVPMSPYEIYDVSGNGTKKHLQYFDYYTQDISLQDVHSLFCNNFVLCNPVNPSLKIQRLSSELNKISLPDSPLTRYVILDFDQVETKTAAQEVVSFFKNNGYCCNIFKSKSYGVVARKFNLKGVLVFSEKLVEQAKKENKTLREVKEGIINYLNVCLKHYCEVDIASTRNASYQAPTFQNDNACLLYQDTQYGNEPFYISNIFDYVTKKTNFSDITFSLDATGWFFNHLRDKYQAELKPQGQGSSSSIFSVALPTEKKSRFSYFWNSNVPFLLQHPQKNKTINMFREFADSVQGSEYLRKQHLEKLKDAFSLVDEQTLDRAFDEGILNNVSISHISCSNSRVHEGGENSTNLLNQLSFLKIETLKVVHSRYFPMNDDIKEICKNIGEGSKHKNKVFLVKGAMGTGKSSVISEILKYKTSRVLFISMRRSLAFDISQKYNIKNYVDNLEQGSETTHTTTHTPTHTLTQTKHKNLYKVGDSFVVQVDSLWRINPNDFDLVIVDEFESLCLYVDSNLKNSPQYIKNLRYLQQCFNKSVVLLDAFINKFSIQTHFADREIILLYNTYKDDCNVYIYEHKQTFITLLEQFAISKKEDEFITCSFGTLSELFSVEKLLSDHGLRVISVTSNTPDEAKNIIYNLFKERNHNKYDVVLFSPTITVGVSILNNVKHHFHYDSGKSVDPISSIQMLKRSRTVENVHIYIKSNQNQSVEDMGINKDVVNVIEVMSSSNQGVNQPNIQPTQPKHTYKHKSYDLRFLNHQVEENIETLLNDIKNIVFFNPDTNKLSKIGEFVNKFVAQSNFINNDHQSSFGVLLEQQFRSFSVVLDDIPHHKFETYKKELNKEYNPFDYCSYKEYKGWISNTEKRRNQEERFIIETIYKVKEFFNFNSGSLTFYLEDKDEMLLTTTVVDEIVFDIAKEYAKDKHYLEKMKRLKLFLEYTSGAIKQEKFDQLINDYLLEHIGNSFQKNKAVKHMEYFASNTEIKLLQYMKTIKQHGKELIPLQSSFSINELKQIEQAPQFSQLASFKDVTFPMFLIKLGYKWKNSQLVLTYNFKKHVSLLLSKSHK